MIDVWLLGLLVAGCALALLVEARRRTRLRLRIVHELELLAVNLDRRRAQLVHLGVQLPEVLPGSDRALELLGRAHRACADALLDWRRQLEDDALAARVRDAEASWSEALDGLHLESPDVQALATLVHLQSRSEQLRASAEDARLHLRQRSRR